MACRSPRILLSNSLGPDPKIKDLDMSAQKRQTLGLYPMETI
jgi:hypothetical protein